MSNVRDLLDIKGRNVFSIEASASSLACVEALAEKGIGALVVSNDSSQLAGIVSERDIARKVILAKQSADDVAVSEIMTSDVVCAYEDTPIEKCMMLMTQHKIRHLPIVSGNKPIGMITVGDVMKMIMEEQSSAIEELESFIFQEEGGEG